MKYKGITNNQAKELLDEYGYNEITELLTVSPLKIFLRQIKTNYIIYLLLFAMGLSFYVGKQITAYTILAVVIIVVVVGFIMEYKAENAIKSLTKMITQMTNVVRSGKEENIPSRELVPDDIIFLKMGDKIPADCIILESNELRVNEAVLTGESKEVVKKVIGKQNIIDNKCNTDKNNLIYMGSFIVNGKCIAKVIHTGMNTEFGKIASMISSAEKEITLQKKVNKIVKYLAINAVLFAAVTGIVMVARNIPLDYDIFVDILIVIIALSVSSFPEGYPVVLITTLASGARRMAAKNAIVNRMSIIETLGETTVICSDKTGTLTKGEMTVRKIFLNNKIYDVDGTGYDIKGGFFLGNKKKDPSDILNLNLLLKTSIICNDSRIKHDENGEYKSYGSPTEIGLLYLAGKANIFKEDFSDERIQEIPFNSHSKMMAVAIKDSNKHMVYSKGAPEIILNHCTHYQKGKKVYKLTSRQRNKILEQYKKFSELSFRSLGFAYKKLDKKSLIDKLIFIGLVGMQDPPRDEVKESIALCHKSGIKVKMLTGDHIDTAVAIAREVGLTGLVIDGSELDTLSENELRIKVKEISIFARVRPEHKLKIVRALKNNGEIVAMTGDGVNDAPALKESHIGIAMGKTGTDVSREVSDLILKDDNFSTIVEAVVEGRTIFKNIQKVSIYQISITLTQLFFVFLAILVNMPLPLVAIQILFINILTDEMTAIMLGFNPPSFDVMEVSPRRGSELIDKSLFKVLLISIGIMIVFAMGTYIYLLNLFGPLSDIPRTTIFALIVSFGIINAFTFRSFRYPVFNLPFNANKLVIYASILSVIAVLIAIYTPANVIFEAVPLPWQLWLVIIFISLLTISTFDLLKVINRKYKLLELH
jgi:P-type Ca2+ transporter type 2C